MGFFVTNFLRGDAIKASNNLWREQPIESPFPDLVREIEIYETEIELRKQDKMDEEKVVLESLTGIKRAGADMIITYHAKDAAGWLARN